MSPVDDGEPQSVRRPAEPPADAADLIVSDGVVIAGGVRCHGMATSGDQAAEPPAGSRPWEFIVEMGLLPTGWRCVSIFIRVTFDHPTVSVSDMATKPKPGTPPTPVSLSGLGTGTGGWFFDEANMDHPLPRSHTIALVVAAREQLAEITGALRLDASIIRPHRRPFGSSGRRALYARSSMPIEFVIPTPSGWVPAPSSSAPVAVPPGAADSATRRPAAAVRLCLAADIQQFSRFRNPEAERAQQRFVEILVRARRHARIDEADVDLQVSGDGQLAFLPPGLDESTVIPQLVEGLGIALARANADLNTHTRLRLRVALHRGHVAAAANGWVGGSTIAVQRLLDSAEARAALADHPEADFILIVPDTLYADVIAHGYGGLPAEAFQSVFVEVPSKDFAEQAWIHVPTPSGSGG
jgi:hypothetical protein